MWPNLPVRCRPTERHASALQVVLIIKMPIPLKSQEANRFVGRARWLALHVALVVICGALFPRDFNRFDDVRTRLVLMLICGALALCAWVQAQTLKRRKWGFIAIASFFFYPMMVVATGNQPGFFRSLTFPLWVTFALYSVYRFWRQAPGSV